MTGAIPAAHLKIRVMTTIEEAKYYWKLLGNIPVNEDDEIEEEFAMTDVVFGVGTDKFEIWQYFEERYNVSVAKDLMNL